MAEDKKVAKKTTSKTTELSITQEPSPVLALILQAVDKDIDIKRLKQLMKLHKKFEADIAKKAYFAAMSRFQSLVPTIPQTGVVDYTPNGKAQVKYNYSTLKDIDKAIKSALEDCGLSYNFMPRQEQNKVKVITQISHIDGHTEAFSLFAQIEIGSIKGLKAVQSTISYLKRYGLSMALGLISGDVDDDGTVGNELYESNDQDNNQDNSQIQDAEYVETFVDAELWSNQLPKWQDQIEKGHGTVQGVIEMLNNKGLRLTEKQLEEISSITKNGEIV